MKFIHVKLFVVVAVILFVDYFIYNNLLAVISSILIVLYGSKLYVVYDLNRITKLLDVKPENKVLLFNNKSFVFLNGSENHTGTNYCYVDIGEEIRLKPNESTKYKVRKSDLNNFIRVKSFKGQTYIYNSKLKIMHNLLRNVGIATVVLETAWIFCILFKGIN